MSTDRRATVLLGRPGELRDRLEAALREAGADIALVVDPANGSAAQVQAQSPRNVVVLMEPGVEEALDAHFDTLFDDPGIELLFEEASVLASRQGWDLARWGRHLSAKLRGSQDVLPEGHGDDAGFVAPLPRDALKPKAEEPAPEEEASTAVEHETAPPLSGIAAQPPQAPGLEDQHWMPAQSDDRAQAQPIDWNSHPTVESDANDDLDYLEPVKRVPHGGGDHHVGAFDPNAFLDSAHHLPDAEPIPLEALEPIDDIAHPHVDVIALEPASSSSDAQPLKLASAATMDAPDMKAAPLHETWSLVDHDNTPAPTSQSPSVASPASRLDGMSMIDDGTIGLEVADSGGTTPGLDIAGTRGAVLVVAGVGGPDPLRALLGQLQDDFPRPILIQQHLDAGNYDRLARQMERATRLKVKLAAAGMTMEDNTVYVLPISVGLEESADGLAFVDMPQVRGFTDVTSKLDPADSALLVLSGAPTDFIEEALRFKVAGAWVAAQAEHGCFDHAVPALVAARGAEIAEPLALAQKLNARWHA